MLVKLKSCKIWRDFALQAEGNKILLLKKVSFADAGNYTCMVESELGADQATSELVVIGKVTTNSLVKY